MQSALKGIPGVQQIDTKIAEREAVVSYNQEGVQTAQLLDALKKAGFPAVVKTQAQPEASEAAGKE